MNIVMKLVGQWFSIDAKKSCLQLLAMTAVSLSVSAPALADCTGFQSNNEEMWCSAPTHWDRYHPVTAVAGSDPYDANSHWIGWQNQVTGECAWDQIGWSNTGELGGWNPQDNRYYHIDSTLIQGSYGDDWLMITGGWIHHCGYWLAPVVFNRPQVNQINVDGDDGNDQIYSNSNGNNAYLLGQAGDDGLFTSRADVYIDGGIGDDYISVHGDESGGFYWADHGNDYLYYFGSNPFALMGCGDGMDGWMGPGTRPADCEN